MTEAVLFDLGGVLTTDPWQSIVLTEGVGLADRYQLDRDRAAAVGDSLWSEYSLSPRDERSYWAAFQAALGVRIPDEVVRQVEGATVLPNPGGRQALRLLENAGIAYGFISDNTAFWYPKQLRLLGLQDSHLLEHQYLSFVHRLSKRSEPTSLFDLAAEQLTPARTLIVDDRPRNVESARVRGFRATEYQMSSGQDLPDVLRRALGGGVDAPGRSHPAADD